MKFSINKVSARYAVAVILLALLSAFAVASIRFHLCVFRAQPEYVFAMYKETDLKQAIFLQNSKKLSLGIINNCQNENAKLVATIIQDDAMCEQEIRLSDITKGQWTNIIVSLSDLHNGKASLNLKALGFSQSDHVDLLLTSGSDFFDLPPVLINGIEQEKVKLPVNYDIFEPTVFLKLPVMFLIFWAVLIFSLTRYRDIISRNKLVFLGVCLIAIQLVKSHIFTNPQISGWAYTLNFFTYKYGFVSRGFAGTCLWALKKLLTGNSFISSKFFHAYSIVLYACLAVILLFFIQRITTKTSETKAAKMVSLITLLYLCSPFSIQYYVRLLGRIDMILGICFIFCCLCILYERFMFLIPAFAFAGIATHQMFVFTYLPILLAALLYIGISKKDKKILTIFAFTTITSGVLAVYFQFFGDPQNVAYADVVSQMQSRTNMPILNDAIEYEWFKSTKDFFASADYDYFTFNVLFHIIGNAILMLPVILIHAAIYIAAFKNEKSKKNNFAVLCTALSPLALLIIIPTPAVDWGRWFMEHSIATSMGMLLLIAKSDLFATAAESVYSSVHVFSKKTIAFSPVILAMLYLACGGVNSLTTDLPAASVPAAQSIVNSLSSVNTDEFTLKTVHSSNTLYSEKTMGLSLKNNKTVSSGFAVNSDEIQMTRINFRAFTWHNNYGENNLIVTISDEKTPSAPLYEAKILMDSVKDNSMTSIPLKNCVLNAGNYIINFQTENELNADFALAANPGQSGHKIVYNGETLNDTDLCIEILGR